MKIFISYSHEDVDFVDDLATILAKRKVNIWLDQWELNYGDSLINKIENALEKAPLVLAVISKSSIKSNWCRKEINSILIEEINTQKALIIPLIIDDCKIPLFLKEKYHLNFNDNPKVAFKNLTQFIKNRSSRSTPVNKENTNYIIDYKIYGVGWDDHQMSILIQKAEIYNDENPGTVYIRSEIVFSDNYSNFLLLKKLRDDKELEDSFIIKVLILIGQLDFKKKQFINLTENEGRTKSFSSTINIFERDLNFEIHSYVSFLGVNNAGSIEVDLHKFYNSASFELDNRLYNFKLNRIYGIEKFSSIRGRYAELKRFDELLDERFPGLAPYPNDFE